MPYSKSVVVRSGSPAILTDRGKNWNLSHSFFDGTNRTNTQTGSRVEGFKTLIREARDASSDFSFIRYKTETQLATCGFYCRWPTNPSTFIEKTYVGAPGFNQTFQGYATPPESKALARVYDKLKHTRSEMNGLAFLGELRETLSMIRRPASTLANAFAAWAGKARDIYGRDPALQGRRNRSRFASVLTDTYLETVFGALPAISDVASAAETLARLEFDYADRVTKFRVRTKSEGAGVPEFLAPKDPFAPESAPLVSVFRWERRRYSVAEVRWAVWIRSQLSCSTPEGAFQKLARVSGLTFENVVPAAYELFPYSFLIDYFSNLGDVVEASFTDTSTYKFGVKTVVVDDYVEVISRYDPNVVISNIQASGYVPVSVYGSSGRAKEIRTSLTRTRQPYLPHPKLDFFIPKSPWKYGNIAALALAQLNRVTR